MAMTPSNMIPLGTAAPEFRLRDTDGTLVSLSDFAGSPALVVAFICNHCP
ncbi:MAG: redoxin family protein, partial [Isosphaeraceae bacterium]